MTSDFKAKFDTPTWTPVSWRNNAVCLLDQTRLPHEVRYVEIDNWPDVATAITDMIVRGAPAIGCTAALGLALAARQSNAKSTVAFMKEMRDTAEVLGKSRPTAVNLFWAIERMLTVAEKASASSGPFLLEAVQSRLLDEALLIVEEDIRTNRQLGAYGAELLPQQVNVLTHCNAGALATAGYGTALGVVRAACEAGKSVHVYADETRPRWQGMKLTAWELQQDGIAVTVIADNMAAVLMREGKIDCVVVGADRIAANGDAANKIGTYNVAVAAHFHSIPFYVAAPLSTVDFSLPDGSKIPIEERSAHEMTHVEHGTERVPVAPADSVVWNPAFDVTPANLITAIVTEKGVVRAPFTESLGLLRNSP